MTDAKAKETTDLSRRGAMTLLAGSAAALAFGCASSPTTAESAGDAGKEGGKAAKDSGAIKDARASGDAADVEGGVCEASPEGEIGPYFADDSAAGFKRTDLTSNIDGTDVQDGIPLTLTVTVVDTEKKCAPYVGAQIDIRHCNAEGVYSDIAAENTSSDSYLRGYQLTDAKGVVTFKTIIPGWYSGRTTHIHLRIRSTYSDASSTSDGTNTTQLFFSQTLVDTLATNVSPYDAQGKNPTTNAGDHVYAQEEDGANLLTLVGNNANGYAASVTIGLPITGRYDASAMGGPVGDGGFMGTPPAIGDGGGG
jgi:protocatechuate 3,4-dioxygenase beta subunit